MFIDPLGLRTEVTVWNGVGAGSSAFGHVTTNINGQNFSWAPGGWDKTYPSADAYNQRQASFRGGTGFALDLTPQEETELAHPGSTAQPTPQRKPPMKSTISIDKNSIL
jgi:hypothetical protein